MNHIHSYSWCCGKWQGAWCHGESNERNACCLTCFEKKMSNTVDFSKMFPAGNCHCLAAPVTAFSRFSGVCLMILAAKWWIASLFKMLHLAFYGVRAFERSMYSTLVPEQQLWKQRCFPILAVLCQQMRCSVLDDISMWRDESYSFILMMLWKVARRMMSWWKEWKKCLLFGLLLEKHVKYSRFCEDVSGGQLPLFGCASDSIL